MLALAAAAGCAPRPALPAVVDAGARYTTAQVEEAANATPLGAAASLTVEQAPAQRQSALAGLRRTGPVGVSAADLLTRMFPASTAAVPVHIEHATVDGIDALIVVEAAQGKAGTLTTRRVWILDDRTGAVIDSASFR